MIAVCCFFWSVCFAENIDKKYTISRDEIDQQFSDFDKEIKEGKAIPTIRNGKIVGYTGRPKPTANKHSVLDNMQLVPSENTPSQSIQR